MDSQARLEGLASIPMLCRHLYRWGALSMPSGPIHGAVPNRDKDVSPSSASVTNLVMGLQLSYPSTDESGDQRHDQTTLATGMARDIDLERGGPGEHG